MTQNVNQAIPQSSSYGSLQFGRWTLLMQPEGQQPTPYSHCLTLLSHAHNGTAVSRR